MPSTIKHYSTLSSGEEAHLFILEAGEFKTCWSDFGASWQSFLMPDSKGILDDVILGYSSFDSCAKDKAYFGATVGRFANRIAGASFAIDGARYPLFANNGPNHLHGGRRGFSRRLWKGELSSIRGDPAIRFSMTSGDGDEGYPGRLDAAATIVLDSSGELTVSYEAVSDRPTPVNLTNHAYFNLAGEGNGTILDHVLFLRCGHYLSVNGDLIPIPGPASSVVGTPFDFRQAKRIGSDVGPSLGGYDHCFIIDETEPRESKNRPFAVVEERSRGRRLEVSTSLPAVQFYTGNFLDGIMGKSGSVYGKHSGFCLETQLYPDSPNRPDFPSCVILPGQKWTHETRFAFSLL